jgi:hypothetical protein
MPSTPYARLLLSIDGGDAAAGASEATAEAAVQPVYESTAGWPATPAPYLEIFEYPLTWTPDPSAGWVQEGAAWRYYGSTPPPAFTAPSLATWGKVKLQLVVGGGKRAGKLSTEMTSEAMAYVRSAEGLESLAWREGKELDDLRSWVGALQRDLRLISTALGAVGALTEAELRAVAATLTAALPVNSQKITGLANGTNPTDAAAFGQIASALASYVAATRAVNTTAPLTGGGALSADRTLAFAPSADVAMGGYGFTGCTGVANSAGDVTCTPKSDSSTVSRKDALTTTYSPSLSARNATAATNVATVQNGPAVCSEGSAWRTSSGGASITVKGGILLVPVSGSSVNARVYRAYDIGSGLGLGDYYATSDPYLFGAAVVVDTLVFTASGNGVRDGIDGNGGIRKNGTHTQFTSGSTNNASLATNGTDRYTVNGSTADVTQALNSTSKRTRQFGTSGVRYELVASKVVTTTDATPTAAFTFAMADNSAIKWEIDVYCYQTGAPNLRAYLARYASFQRNGGAPVKDFEVNKHADQVINSGGAWGTPPVVAITESNPTTNDVSVIFTGLGGTSIKWAVDVKIQVTTTSA